MELYRDNFESNRLCDRDIIAKLAHDDPTRRIIITPLISLQDQLGPSSIDLRLGTEFIVTERQNYAHLDPLDAYENAYKIETTGKKQEFKDHDVRFRLIKRLSPLEPFILHPYEFALGSTLEYIRIPVDLVAQLEGRSTWARLGTLVHLTAGLIHPGSEGTITFELLNAGDLPIMLYPGLRIAQLVFYRLDKPYKLYDQAHEVKYSKNLRVSKPVYWEDEEVKVLYKARKARLEAEARKRRDNRCGE